MLKWFGNATALGRNINLMLGWWTFSGIYFKST